MSTSLSLERVEILRLALERHDDDDKALALAERMLLMLSGTTAIHHPGIPAPAADALTEHEAEYLEDMEALENLRAEPDTPSATEAKGVGAADAYPDAPPPPMDPDEAEPGSCPEASDNSLPTVERAAGRDWEWSDKHTAELRRRAESGETDPEIAEAMGLPIMLVEKKRRKFGIKKRELPRGDRSKTKAERQARVRKMVAASATAEAMASALGVSRVTIYKDLNELGLIGVRPKGPQPDQAVALLSGRPESRSVDHQPTPVEEAEEADNDAGGADAEDTPRSDMRSPMDVRKPFSRKAPAQIPEAARAREQALIDQHIADHGVRTFEPGPFLDLALRTLEEKGHRIEPGPQKLGRGGGPRWRVDGKLHNQTQLVAKANEYRLARGLEPFTPKTENPTQ